MSTKRKRERNKVDESGSPDDNLKQENLTFYSSDIESETVTPILSLRGRATDFFQDIRKQNYIKPLLLVLILGLIFGGIMSSLAFGYQNFVLKNRIAVLQSQASSYQYQNVKAIQNITVLSRDIEKKASQIASLEQINENLTITNAEISQEINQTKNDYAAVSSELEFVEKEVESLEKEKEYLNEVIDDLKHFLPPDENEDEDSEDDNKEKDDADTLPKPETEIPHTIEINIISKCTKIYDGDTFKISNGEVIRLADIDSPEEGQTGYQESSDALKSLIYGKNVYLEVDDIYGTTQEGKGGRYVCVVYLKSGLNINLKLINDGYAKLDDYPNEFNPDNWDLDNSLDLSKADDHRETTPEPDLKPDPDPDPDPDPWLDDGPFWGSKKSNKYHKPSCYWAKQIKPENLIIFKTRRAAINKGYVACKVCKP